MKKIQLKEISKKVEQKSNPWKEKNFQGTEVLGEFRFEHI